MLEKGWREYVLTDRESPDDDNWAKYLFPPQFISRADVLDDGWREEASLRKIESIQSGVSHHSFPTCQETTRFPTFDHTFNML
jgi:hypothetical protein